MTRIILSIAIALTLVATGCNRAANHASEACKAAEKGNIEQAQNFADQAFEHFNELNVDALCHLAASYAYITLTTGDQQAADRFQKCYKASINSNKAEAERVYHSLDPQMADGLAIISGMLKGRDNFTIDSEDSTRDSLRQLEADIATEGLSEL